MTYRGLRRILLSVCLLAIAATILYFQFATNKTWSPWHLPLSGKTIVIDPGHGGIDGGAVSADGKVVEKEINLAVSLFLRDYLQEAGAIVIMTREVDKDLADENSRRRKTSDLHRRARLINESGAYAMVSIHMNAITSSRWRGAQTFYDSKAGEESKRLAKLIQAELVRNLENTDRIAKSVENIFLLKTATMPNALVEVGFLSNDEEARLLADENYQRKVAAAIYQGLLRFAAGEQP